MFIPDPDFFHPGSGFFFIPDSGSGFRIQGSKMHQIPDPDPQHCIQNHSQIFGTARDIAKVADIKTRFIHNSDKRIAVPVPYRASKGFFRSGLLIRIAFVLQYGIPV
jgi:hypothetical protein